MAPPPSMILSPVVTLVLRLLTAIFLLISVIILATNKATVAAGYYFQVDIKFNDFYAYRYMLATGVIGMAYTLLQIVFTVFHVISGNRIGGDATILLDFFADKVLSYILATGAAAGFGLTVDMNRATGNGSDTQTFLDKANAAASLLFIGFIFSAITSILSSFSLSKRS